jgi:hypothetical protein
MSLLTFHRGLITVAIVFCVGYGVWEITRHFGSPGDGSFLVGSLFVVLGGGLAWYLARLNRILGYPTAADRGSDQGVSR